jgi:hypothetical protein
MKPAGEGLIAEGEPGGLHEERELVEEFTAASSISGCGGRPDSRAARGARRRR